MIRAVLVVWGVGMSLALGQLVVTNAADSGPGSLRQLVAEAETGTMVMFDPALSGSTITLASPIVIDKAVVIGSDQLPEGLTLSGGGQSRIFTITATGNLELNGLTLRDGRAPAGAAGAPGINATIFSPATPGQPGSPGGHGGAMVNDGQLRLEGCSLIGNRAGNGGSGGSGGNGQVSVFQTPATGGAGGAGGSGGAIFNNGSVTIVHCTFSGNAAGNGGSGGAGGLSSSGMRANGGSGGSGGHGGVISGPGTSNLQLATCALNNAGNGGFPGIGGSPAAGASGRGGALHGNGLTLRNSLIAGNTVADAGDGRDVSGAVTSLGHNLIGTSNGSSGWLPGVGDLTGSNATPIDARLGPLADNGGKTPTHEPAPDSPAVDAAEPGVDGLDQRGLPRRSGGRADIGAVEYQYPPVLAAELLGGVLLANGGTVDFGRLNPFDGSSRTVLLTNLGESPLTGLTVELIGADADNFELTGPGTTTLVNSQVAQVGIQFVGTTSGEKSATLRISSNDPVNNPFDLQVVCAVNSRPTDIRLSRHTVLENSAPGTVIGTLEGTDPDPGETLTYEVVGVLPTGFDGLFTAVGNELRIAASPDYESQNGFEVAVVATDALGLFHTRTFFVRVEDVDEDPVVGQLQDVVRPFGAPPFTVQFPAYDQELPNRLTVDAPAAVAGEYAMSAATFGPAFPAEGLAIELVAADPLLGMPTPTAALTNAAECAGKAVLFARGTYSFHHKFLNAEASGAIAAIVFQNPTDAFPGNLGSPTGTSVLPGGMISRVDGRLLLAAAEEEAVTGTVRPFPAGMTLEVTSDNPVLLPPSGILLGPPNTVSVYPLTLTPAIGMSGTATITVRAADFTGNETVRRFQYTVEAPSLVSSEGTGGPPLGGDAVIDLGVLVVGEAASRSLTIRNTAGAEVSLGEWSIHGDGAAFFETEAEGWPAVLAADAESTLVVRYRPQSVGSHPAVLRLVSPTGAVLVEFGLSGRAVSPDHDSDGDGLNDAAEARFAALGFDWQVAQPELVATLMDSANLAGLFRREQVQALNVGTPLLERDATGKVTLRLKVAKSTDLRDFLPLDFSTGQLLTNPAEGRIDLEFTPGDDAAFFRVEAE